MAARSNLALDPLDRFGGLAPLPIRLFLGVFLIYLAQDNVLSTPRTAELEHYAQFACGILVLLGAFTRWAALVMVINFTVVILGGHLALPLRTFLEPTAMLATALALFIGGPGRLSVDAWRTR